MASAQMLPLPISRRSCSGAAEQSQNSVTMVASGPKPDGEIVITRYTLHELLDKLAELTAGDDEAEGG